MQFLNWIAMSTFELKTHQVGKTYSNPHFFILNKGKYKVVFFVNSKQSGTSLWPVFINFCQKDLMENHVKN